MIEFSVSGVTTHWWLPILVAFLISSITSMAGVTGAFLLLPFQVSVLGFTTPAVTPTNLLFNVVAIPLGVIRYVREKRILWSLLMVLLSGLLPGLLGGIWVRIRLLPDPRYFKLFVAGVLFYLVIRLLLDLRRKEDGARAFVSSLKVEMVEFNWRRLVFWFHGENYTLLVWQVWLFSLIVGLIGGIYGVGGGALLVPVLVTVFRIPVHAVAGVALLSTFSTSAAGVVLYQTVGPYLTQTNMAVQPDWFLGTLFGLGGIAGIYTGSLLQQRFRPTWIKLILTLCLFGVIVKYILESLI